MPPLDGLVAQVLGASSGRLAPRRRRSKHAALSVVKPGETAQQITVRRRLYYPQAGLSLDERSRSRQAPLHGHEGVAAPVKRLLKQLTVLHADHAKTSVIERTTRRRRLLALGLDQPGVEHVIYPLGVPGVGPVDNLAQARLGHDELEHGPLVDHEDHPQDVNFIGQALDDEIDVLRMIFMVNERAMFEFVVTEASLREVD